MVWGCPCMGEQPPPKRARPKIDRSMIGEPTNFQHTGHIGSGESSSLGTKLPSIELQMKSKGGHLESEQGSLPESASPANRAIPLQEAQEAVALERAASMSQERPETTDNKGTEDAPAVSTPGYEKEEEDVATLET
eukprot:m.334290 g.334290  ORF g.334290 m.334290 type:complete len:136 (+) comp17328_c0_seq1:411-818(+)